MLQGKKILLGVCGGIAAYKSAYLIREFIKRGAEVKVIMTTSASFFIHPLTLSTLSRNPVLKDFVNEQGEWNNHVELGLWADIMVVAPATANTLAKFANGICDNLLCAAYLSAKCDVVVCPAMDLDMYLHPSVQQNLSKLKTYGNNIIDAEEGELASGLIGKGRLAEPLTIVSKIENHFKKKNDLKGSRVLITAGPTYERIDPVRFIGNHSSGKMGYEIAKSCLQRGAEVTLITGPSHLQIEHQNLTKIAIFSAEEMLLEAKKYHASASICVFCAAVADYKPEHIEQQKIKKSDEAIHLKLIKNPDIAFELGKNKNKNQLHVGFALETNNEEANAKEKLNKKNFDIIILNSLNDEGAGFGGDTNKISIIEQNKIKKIELKSKHEVAEDIVEFISNKVNA